MPMVQPRTFVTSPLWMSEMSDTPAGEDGVIPEEAQDNPCWQDLYDDDCDTSVYAANFVAAKWIKSMPCASGVEDCDMPEALQVPSVKEDGVAEVDVMDFLGLKRAPKEVADKE